MQQPDYNEPTTQAQRNEFRLAQFNKATNALIKDCAKRCGLFTVSTNKSVSEEQETCLQTCSNNISATRNWFMDAFRKDFAIPGMARFRPPKEEEEGEGGEEEDE